MNVGASVVAGEVAREGWTMRKERGSSTRHQRKDANKRLHGGSTNTGPREERRRKGQSRREKRRPAYLTLWSSLPGTGLAHAACRQEPILEVLSCSTMLCGPSQPQTKAKMTQHRCFLTRAEHKARLWPPADAARRRQKQARRCESPQRHEGRGRRPPLRSSRCPPPLSQKVDPGNGSRVGGKSRTRPCFSPTLRDR